MIPYNSLREFYKERDAPRVVIPQYERCDGNNPPPWLVRRMNTKIDRRIK